MPRQLPYFEPFTLAELRSLYAQHPNKTIQRLVLEVVRYRQVITEVDQLYKHTHQAWRHHVGGDLTALHMMQIIMNKERQRLM